MVRAGSDDHTSHESLDAGAPGRAKGPTGFGEGRSGRHQIVDERDPERGGPSDEGPLQVRLPLACIEGGLVHGPTPVTEQRDEGQPELPRHDPGDGFGVVETPRPDVPTTCRDPRQHVRPAPFRPDTFD